MKLLIKLSYLFANLKPRFFYAPLFTCIFVYLLVIPSPAHAQSSIFGGGSSGGGSSIFGNIGDQIRYIFEGRDVELGGSTVPFGPTAPSGTPAPPAGQFLKVQITWDTMWRTGVLPGEGVEVVEPEPPTGEVTPTPLSGGLGSGQSLASCTYYLSPNGNDSASGTSESEPWKTFDHAIPQLQPGEALCLADGEYTNTNSGLLYADCNAGGNALNGQSGSPISVQAINQRHAFINSNGSQGPIRIFGCSYWDIDGITARNTDNPNGHNGSVVTVDHGNYVSLTNMISYWPNRYLNAHGYDIQYSKNILLSDSELYNFFRHGVSVFGSHNVTIRRVYANSRGQLDIPGGYESDRPGGDEAFVFYWTSDSIVENSIAENRTRGFEVHGGTTYDGFPGGYNNKILGSIHFTGHSENHYAAGTDTRMGKLTGNVVRPAYNNLFKDLLVIDYSNQGFQNVSSVGTRLENLTVYNGLTGNAVNAREKSTSPTNDPSNDQRPICGLSLSDSFFDGMDKSIFTGSTFDCSFSLLNSLVYNNNATGVGISSGNWDWSVNYSNVYNNNPDYSNPETISDNSGNIRNSLSVAPTQMGMGAEDSLICVPSSSNMSDAGQNGADIGANIVYRYENGTLTNTPLWNTSTGAFPCGATYPGINDNTGNSCTGVHVRLHVNAQTLQKCGVTTTASTKIETPSTVASSSGILAKLTNAIGGLFGNKPSTTSQQDAQDFSLASTASAQTSDTQGSVLQANSGGNPCAEGQYLDLSSTPNVCRPLKFPDRGFDWNQFNQAHGSQEYTLQTCTQSALETLLSSVDSRGGTVHLPACTIAINGSRLTLPSNIIFQGAGVSQTKFVVHRDQGVHVAEGMSNIIIRDMEIDGENNGNRILYLEAASNVLIERVNVHNTLDRLGIYLGASDHVTVRYSESHHNGRHGIADAVTSRSTGEYGGADTVAIYSNKLYNNSLNTSLGGHGIDFHGSSAEIAGNLIQNNNYGAKFPAARNVYVHHNLFLDNAHRALRTVEYDTDRPARDNTFCQNQIIGTSDVPVRIATDTVNNYLLFNHYEDNNPETIVNGSTTTYVCPNSEDASMPIDGTAVNTAPQDACNFCNDDSATAPSDSGGGVSGGVTYNVCSMAASGTTAAGSGTTASCTKFVATTGNDSNTGTEAQPWKTIQKAASSAQPGDVVCIRGGTYNEAITQGVSGATNQLIIYKNYPGEIPIIGDDGAPGRYRWRLTDQSNITIEGFHFEHYLYGAIMTEAVNSNISNVSVTNNSFYDQQFDGIFGSNLHTVLAITRSPERTITNYTVSGNRFENILNGDSRANETLTITGRVQNAKIINNFIKHVNNIGIDLIGREDWGGGPKNVLIKGNWVEDHGFDPLNNANGIYTDGAGENIIIEDNVVISGTDGINISLEPEAALYLNTRHVIVRRNIIVNNDSYNLRLGSLAQNVDEDNGTHGFVWDSVAVHNTVYATEGAYAGNMDFGAGAELRWSNNIFSSLMQSPRHYRYSDNFTVNGTMKWVNTWWLDYNLFETPPGETKEFQWETGDYQGLAAFQTTTGQELHSLEGNPQFANAAGNDFTLTSGSPAIDAAGPLTTTTSGGSGNVVPVVDARYFTNGFGVQGGDLIKIGGNGPYEVTAVNYDSNVLTISTSASWNNGDPVNYNYGGNGGPDIGACDSELAAQTGATSSSGGLDGISGIDAAGGLVTGGYSGPQPEAQPEDPLAEIHKAFILENGCCASCGEVVVDGDLIIQDAFGNPYVIAEDVHIDHALYGMCGGPSSYDSNFIPTPDGSVTSVPLESPGPNGEILPNAIPNKLIRRDGYTFMCVSVACFDNYTKPTPADGVPTPTSVPKLPPYWLPATHYNYIEFQTEIFHSNDFKIDLHLANVGDQDIEDIGVFRHYNDTSENPPEWPHNMDIGTELSPEQMDRYPLGGFNTLMYKLGDTEVATFQAAGSLAAGVSTTIAQYSDKGLRYAIPSVIGEFGPGISTPRDYDMGTGPKEILLPFDSVTMDPLTQTEYTALSYEFKDVSTLGGCGYEASSNNSIIGPIIYDVRYGNEGDGDLSSRSVALLSIPVGNPVDDEAPPFGWPVTGRVSENWGKSGQAQEAGEYRNVVYGREEYSEYISCVDEGSTYPHDGRPTAGKYLHPGIDIDPAVTQVRPPGVHTTHAGWVTYAGYDPNYPDKGYTVQIESDLNRDFIPDVLTRYTHLQEGSIQFNARHVEDSSDAFGRKDFLFGNYVPRNALIGFMGDSGSTGDTHTQYEILYLHDSTEDVLPTGDIGPNRCADDPYIANCTTGSTAAGQFFSKLRFEPTLILGPTFVNP